MIHARTARGLSTCSVIYEIFRDLVDISVTFSEKYLDRQTHGQTDKRISVS